MPTRRDDTKYPHGERMARVHRTAVESKTAHLSSVFPSKQTRGEHFGGHVALLVWTVVRLDALEKSADSKTGQTVPKSGAGTPGHHAGRERLWTGILCTVSDGISAGVPIYRTQLPNVLS